MFHKVSRTSGEQNKINAVHVQKHSAAISVLIVIRPISYTDLGRDISRSCALRVEISMFRDYCWIEILLIRANHTYYHCTV
jgi:hypothetical protein